MTDRIRSLLDAAVAGTLPRVADPVPEVLRRRRAHRLHRMVTAGAAGAAAIALLTTGGLVAVIWAGGGPTPADRSASTGPQPTPPPLPSERPTTKLGPRRTVAATVTGGAVRVNGLILKVPSGWQVVGDSGQQVTDCQVQPRSILVNVSWLPGGDCDSRAQIQVRPWYPVSYPPGIPKNFSEGISEIVLPGGQPAWLTDNAVNNVRAFDRSQWAAFNVGMPWAGAGLSVEVASKELGSVLGSISSEQTVPGRLVLPNSSPTAVLGQRDQDRIDSTDASAVAQVLERLRGLDQVVQDGELPCPSAQPLTPSWTLAGQDMAALTFSYPSGATQAVVAISSTDGCAFATSSMGGRVWLPAGFLAEIRALLTNGGN